MQQAIQLTLAPHLYLVMNGQRLCSVPHHDSLSISYLDPIASVKSMLLRFLLLPFLPGLVDGSSTWLPPKMRPKDDSWRKSVAPKTPWDFECKVLEPEQHFVWPRVDSPPAAFLQSASSSPRMLPLRIQYVLAESTSREHEYLMRWAFLFVNEFLTERIKTEPMVLDALRYDRYINPNSSSCTLPSICRYAKVPGEYLLPCSLGVEKGIPQEASEYMRLASSQNVSMIVYVRVIDPKYRGSEQCEENASSRKKLAFASSCLRNSLNGRALHTMIVFCKQPTDLEHAHLVMILLHETLHALMGSTLQGYETTKYLPNEPIVSRSDAKIAERKAKLHRRTWQNMTLRWQRKNERRTQVFNTEVVITPSVLEVTRDYFRCYTKPIGAEVALAVYPDGVTRPDGDHWSARLFPEEVLSPMISGPDMVLSKLTLAALKDTGWYEVNMALAQPLDFDASRHVDRGEYCHLATQGCDSVLENVKDKWYQNPSVLEWAGPYCDPTGDISTRACSPDGRLRYKCWYDRSSVYTAGCSVYVKNSTMDTFGINCTNPPRSWEDVIARQEQGAYAFYSMCLTFTQYQTRRGDSYLLNYPACYEFNCSRTTRSFDFYVFGHGIPTCNVSRMCGPNSSSVVEWKASGGQCFPPGWGNLVCPSYADVCEKPGGLGTWDLPKIPAAKRPRDKGSSSGCVLQVNKISKVITIIAGFIMVLQY